MMADRIGLAAEFAARSEDRARAANIGRDLSGTIIVDVLHRAAGDLHELHRKLVGLRAPDRLGRLFIVGSIYIIFLAGFMHFLSPVITMLLVLVPILVSPLLLIRFCLADRRRLIQLRDTTPEVHDAAQDYPEGSAGRVMADLTVITRQVEASLTSVTEAWRILGPRASEAIEAETCRPKRKRQPQEIHEAVLAQRPIASLFHAEALLGGMNCGFSSLGSLPVKEERALLMEVGRRLLAAIVVVVFVTGPIDQAKKVIGSARRSNVGARYGQRGTGR
jgi:hypothetical protein